MGIWSRTITAFVLFIVLVWLANDIGRLLVGLVPMPPALAQLIDSDACKTGAQVPSVSSLTLPA